MAQGKSKIAKDILRRVRWLYVIFLLVGVAIFARVIWIQYGPQGAELREKAHKITFERVAIEAERGDILAGDGRILATSIPTYEIRMDFAAAGMSDEIFAREVDSLAWYLSDFFSDKSQGAYKSMLEGARRNKDANRYKLISPRRVNYLEEKQVARFPLFRLGQNKGGYIKVQVNKRLMPHGTLAQRTIGMTNQDGVKIGVEGAFDQQLRGKDGQEMRQRVSGNFWVPVPDPGNVEPVNGMDVVTTLDVDIQDVAETMLKRQLEVGNAQWGTVVLMEVATGDIHAMANITRKSPGVYVEDFNYAIGRRMEPGSTFKLATLITLLEDGGMSLDDMVNCHNGRTEIGGRPVVDDHAEKIIPLRRVFEVSSNIGFAESVYKRYKGREVRYVDFIKSLGMDTPLDMQIPGERRPLIKDPREKDPRSFEYWDGMTLVRMAYGYALEITPMQTLALYNAIANDGKMMRPRLVKEIRSFGQTVRTFDTEVLKPAICSPKTVKLVQECLAGVADEGTGRLMRNPYYTAAVKTGTAQVALERGGYMDHSGGRHYLATFVGYFPADKPKYSCIVAIKTYFGPGARQTYYGASLSGPVFRAISDRVYASHPAWHDPVDNSGEKKPPYASDVKNGDTKMLKTAAAKLSVPVDIERGAGTWAYVAAGTQEIAERNPLSIPLRYAENQEAVVPDVTGMGLRDAVFLLESHGMKVTFSGRGRVVAQSVTAGTPVADGRAIHLEMKI